MVLGRFPVPPDSSPRTWRCHDGLTRLRLQDAQAPRQAGRLPWAGVVSMMKRALKWAVKWEIFHRISMVMNGDSYGF